MNISQHIKLSLALEEIIVNCRKTATWSSRCLSPISVGTIDICGTHELKVFEIDGMLVLDRKEFDKATGNRDNA